MDKHDIRTLNVLAVLIADAIADEFNSEEQAVICQLLTLVINALRMYNNEKKD